MDKNSDFNGFGGTFNGGFYGYSPYENFDPMAQDTTFNPIAQYEQGFMYYRYLTQAVEYKIKCKEYEKMCGKESKAER